MLLSRLFVSLFILFFSLQAHAFINLAHKTEFLPVEEAFSLQLISHNETAVLQWQITKGHYLYRHSIKARDNSGKQIELELPAGIDNQDDYFGKTQIYRMQLQSKLALEQDWPISVTWQGCADAGLCYPPQTTVLQPKNKPAKLAEDQGIAAQLANAGLLANIAAFFVMGLLLAFTPCMLPMLPILSSVIAGSKPGGWHGAKLGIAFVIPMAMIYAILGVVAAQLGSNLSAALQNPWLLYPFAGLFIILAVAQFGLFNLQLPAAIRERIQRQDQQVKGGSLLGAATLGVFSALLVGPCMTAPLAGALLYIGQSGDAVSGGLALFALGIGSGLPLLLAMSMGMRWLPKPGEWMQTVNHVFAYALLAAAIFVLQPVISAQATLLLWAALSLAIAIQLSQSNTGQPSYLKKYAAAVLIVYSSLLCVGAFTGGNDPLRPLANLGASSPTNVTSQRIEEPELIYQQLEQARSKQQWVLMDFYADWCVSCKVMENTVFGQTEVQQAIADMLFIQPDVTDNNQAQQELLRRFGIMGPPTILFIAPDGKEVRAARITGEVNAEGFLKHLQQARSGY